MGNFSYKQRFLSTLLALSLLGATNAARGEGGGRSWHAGLFYPHGVDVIGYTVENSFTEHLYGYYTFGFPALAAAGVNYYQSYRGEGWVASAGTGIGFLNQGNYSLAYQWPLAAGADPTFLKLGVGYFGSLIANGPFPVLSFERRLE